MTTGPTGGRSANWFSKWRTKGDPGDHNRYDTVRGWVTAGTTTDAMLQGIDLEELSTNLDRWRTFKSRPSKRSGTGDFLVRIAMMYGQQPEGAKLRDCGSLRPRLIMPRPRDSL